MKKFRKLLPALSMLLISALLMGSSTFAWFSMNTTVSATGMKVQATTSKNLVISTDKTLKNNENTSISSVQANPLYLRPVSTGSIGGETVSFFKNTSGVNIDYTTGNKKEGAIFEAATVTDVTSSTTSSSTTVFDVVKYTFYIRADMPANSSDESKFSKLVVSNIEFNGSTSKNISKSLRVGVRCLTGETTVGGGFIYAPVTGHSTSYKAIVKAGTVSSTDTLESESNVVISTAQSIANGNDSNLLGASKLGSDYVTVEIYVWYEGQDAACTSANSIDSEGLDLKISFEAN